MTQAQDQAFDGKYELLRDVTVLDVTRFLAGPWCTALLAGFGARVLKVEAPGDGDQSRGQPPFLSREGLVAERKAPSPDDMGLAFWKRNRGKQSICLDLKTTDGRNVVYRLLKHIDVVIHNFRPGVAEKLGLAPNKVWEFSGDAVYCAISGYGRYRFSGVPEDDLGAADFQVQALSGLMSVTGFPDGPPVRVRPMVADHLTGVNAAAAICAALARRAVDRAGGRSKGTYLEVPMLGSVANLVWDEALDFYAAQGMPERVGNESPRLVPFTTFETADGHYLAIGAGYDHSWTRLVSCEGLRHLADRTDLRTVAGRIAHRDEVQAEVAKWARARRLSELMQSLIAARVEVAPVYSPTDALTDPSYRETVLAEVDDPRFHDVDAAAARFPAYVDGRSLRHALPLPPLLGADTDSVLKEFLRIGDEELERLESVGAIRRHRRPAELAP